eukprot:NODE_46_length_27655_cov_0.671796.p10 type:complete len:330 gc:universal NODE_46_length_27655_cov_0.671796:27490-26501(-)
MVHPKKKRKLEIDVDSLYLELQSNKELDKMTASLNKPKPIEQEELKVFDSIIYSSCIMIECELKGFDLSLEQYAVYFVRNQPTRIELNMKKWNWLVHYMDNVHGEKYKVTDMSGNLIKNYINKPVPSTAELLRCLAFNSEQYKGFDLEIVYQMYLAHEEYFESFLSIFSKFKNKKNLELYMKFSQYNYSTLQLAHIGYKTCKLIIGAKLGSTKLYISMIFWRILEKPSELDGFELLEYIPALQDISTKSITNENSDIIGYAILCMSLMLLNYAKNEINLFSPKIQKDLSSWHSIVVMLMNKYSNCGQHLRQAHLTLNHLLDICITSLRQ